MKFLNDQPSQPRDSHNWQSYSKGLKEIRVLCEEQPPSTFALECRMCELPVRVSRDRTEATESREKTTGNYIKANRFLVLSADVLQEDLFVGRGGEVVPTHWLLSSTVVIVEFSAE